MRPKEQGGDSLTREQVERLLSSKSTLRVSPARILVQPARLEVAQTRLDTTPTRLNMSGAENPTMHQAGVAKPENEQKEDELRLIREKLAAAQVALNASHGENAKLKQEVDGLRKQISELRVNPRDHLGYFKTMGLDPDVFEGLSEDEVRARLKVNYLQIANKNHPDRGGSVEKMKMVNAANDILSSPELRSQYMTRTGRFAPRRQ